MKVLFSFSFFFLFVLSTPKLFSQDTLHFKNGKTQLVKLIEIDSAGGIVKYIEPNNIDSINHYVSLQIISKIVDRNGHTTTIITSKKPSDIAMKFIPGKFLLGFYPSDFAGENLNTGANYYNAIFSVAFQYQFFKNRFGLEFLYRKGLNPSVLNLSNLSERRQNDLRYETGLRVMYFGKRIHVINYLCGIGFNSGKILSTNAYPIYTQDMWGREIVSGYNYEEVAIPLVFIYNRQGISINTCKYLSFFLAFDSGISNRFGHWHNDDLYVFKPDCSFHFGIYLRLGSKNGINKRLK